MKDFSSLKKNLKKDFSSFKEIKVALLGDSATQLLSQAIRGTGYNENLNINIFEADFNQIERQIYDPTSELYDFNPQYIILFISSYKLLQSYNKSLTQISFAEEQLQRIKDLITTINNKLDAKIIIYNFNEIDDSVYGSYASKVESSFLFQIRKLNFNLSSYIIEIPNCYVCDLSSIQNQIGFNNLFSPSIYVNTEMVLSIESLPVIAFRTVAIVSSLIGKIKKCLILDLDNTLWGGVIGDDGIENIQLGSLGIGKAFTEFQYWIKKLKNRGIIIAVCSKNTESIAKEPFLKHPDMILKLDDVAVFIANWNNKVDNIRQIQRILNIGFDSMVFVDDNPFERNMVKEQIEDICIPDLPEDPANYLQYLSSLDLFETTNFSEEDAKRTTQYQTEFKRLSEKMNFSNEDDYLKSLNMLSDISEFNSFNSPRVSQLSQRSNQFNLRTIRYDEDNIIKISNNSDYATFAFTLEDKYGDNGLICVVILKKLDKDILFIDSWFMSCRVLKRGMENFVLNSLVTYAKENNYKTIIGEYLPTSKNGIVANHYNSLGFKETSTNKWTLSVDNYITKKCFINKK
ncbi:MAG: HAD-IIIC family phosphatase [Bacteroidales bacterium]|nr:HAD-IIIC family phosphatase [Bacteroidales bacterium]